MEERADVMTDFQFKSIIKMVLSIAQKSGDLKAVIAELEKLLPSNERSDADKTNNDNYSINIAHIGIPGREVTAGRSASY